jgi:hypothetical protein
VDVGDEVALDVGVGDTRVGVRVGLGTGVRVGTGVGVDVGNLVGVGVDVDVGISAANCGMSPSLTVATAAGPA